MTQTAPTTPTTPSIAAEILNGLKPSPATTPSDVPAATPQVPEDKKTASKFQILLDREKKALEIEQRAKAKEKEIEEKLARIKEFDDVKTTNPLKALELLGLDYNALTQAQLNNGQITPEIEVKRVETKLDSFLKHQEEQDQRREQDKKDSEELENKRLIEEFKGEINDYVKENPDRYEFISFENSQELVYLIIDEHYERTRNPETGKGDVLTIAQAADKVEEYLEQKYVKAKGLKKLQALLGPLTAVKSAEKPTETKSQKPKTLTNQASAVPAPIPNRILTDEERIQRAIAYAKGMRS